MIISSAASSESDAAETPWTGPSCRSRAIAVALALDRGVRPPQQPRAVLVAVLQELEQRADRLVGHLGRRDVAHEQQPCAAASVGTSDTRDSR